MDQLIQALERRGVEPLETGKNYIGFESADDASEAYVFLKRDFPSLRLKVIADRVEVKGLGKSASNRKALPMRRTASQVIRELEMRIARLERTSAKIDSDIQKVFDDLTSKLVAVAKAQSEAEKKAVADGTIEDGDQVMYEHFDKGRLIGHTLDALNKLEDTFLNTIQESRDNIKRGK